MKSAAALRQKMAHSVMVLDGAMGTMLQRFSFDEAAFRGERFADHGQLLQGNNDLLCLTQAAAVRSVHEAYLKAGARLIETNTFNSTSLEQRKYGLEEYCGEINRQAVTIVREAIAAQGLEGEAWVVGSIGPTSISLSLSQDVDDPSKRACDFANLSQAYAEQISALAEGGRRSAAH